MNTNGRLAQLFIVATIVVNSIWIPNLASADPDFKHFTTYKGDHYFPNVDAPAFKDKFSVWNDDQGNIWYNNCDNNDWSKNHVQVIRHRRHKHHFATSNRCAKAPLA